MPLSNASPNNGRERIQKLDGADNSEKSYPTKLNREDREDRKEDIFVGSMLIVHAPYLIVRQLNEPKIFSLRSLRFKIQKDNQRHL